MVFVMSLLKTGMGHLFMALPFFFNNGFRLQYCFIFSLFPCCVNVSNLPNFYFATVAFSRMLLYSEKQNHISRLNPFFIIHSLLFGIF